MAEEVEQTGAAAPAPEADAVQLAAGEATPETRDASAADGPPVDVDGDAETSKLPEPSAPSDDVQPPANDPPPQVDAAPPQDAPAPEADAEIASDVRGPRWFSIHTPSQAAPVNLLLADAGRDMEQNSLAAIERFKRGHGIQHTPHAIHVRALPPDYEPTAADLDHHEAIEASQQSPPAE
jgi:hypothetical protein